MTPSDASTLSTSTGETSPAQQRALEVVASVAGRESSSLRPDHNLVGDLGIDSPKALQMLLELEEQLEIEITDEQAGAMETLGDVLVAVAAAADAANPTGG